MQRFQLSLRGCFVRGTRSSLASSAYPLSGSGSGPASLQNPEPLSRIPSSWSLALDLCQPGGAWAQDDKPRRDVKHLKGIKGGRTTSSGLTHFTPREQQVLGLLATGQFKKEIGDQLGNAEDTVRTHCSRTYEKLHVNCREYAIAKTIPFTALASIRPKNHD